MMTHQYSSSSFYIHGLQDETIICFYHIAIVTIFSDDTNDNRITKEKRISATLLELSLYSSIMHW